MFIVKKPIEDLNRPLIRPATTYDFLNYDKYKNAISDIEDILAKHTQQINELKNNLIIDTSQTKIAYITLLADAWQGTDSPYSQIVNIEDITTNSKVDLSLSAEQLLDLRNKNLSFVTENIEGTLTVYAIGQKPIDNYNFQATITELLDM